MSVLLKNISQIKDHWHAVASDLESILPKSGGRYRADFEHTVVTLVCSNFPGETADRIGGTKVPVVPLVQTTPDDTPLHWLGWYEEWGTPVRRSRHQLQFCASAITVYYGKPESQKRQLLRAEWTGVLREEAGKDIFQSPGAAHPHWHVDGIRSYFNEFKDRLDRPAQVDALAVEQVREFGADKNQQHGAEPFMESPLAFPSRSELSWTGIHLAAHARWSEQPWPGPAGPHDTHAAGPTDLPPLRQWLKSCAYYLQAQIQDQLLRSRW